MDCKFRISIAANILLLSVLFILVWKSDLAGKIYRRIYPSSRMSEVMKFQKNDLSKYLSTLQKKQIKAVFLGDSITRIAAQYFPGYLESSGIVFAGIDGDGVRGVEARLDEIMALHPKKVFLMIGINDIRSGGEVKDLLVVYETILERFEKEKIPLFLQSVLPLGERDIFHQINPRILNLNQQLQRIASERKIVYIDLTPNFEENGYLGEKWTDDGLHLNFEGCRVWADQIRKLLD